MHWFFPGAFVFGPALLFFAFFKILLFLLLIMLIVRLVTHGRRYGGYGYGPWHGHGYGYAHGYGPTAGAAQYDPRRIAAMRYASGQIDRAEFDRIMSGLDSTAPTAPPAPPTPPVPPVAPPQA